MKGTWPNSKFYGFVTVDYGYDSAIFPSLIFEEYHIYSSFLQVLSAEDARGAIKNVSNVIEPGGDIYIRGYGIIDDSRISPQKNVGFNLVYINVYDEGRAYTEQEHKGWLKDAGFEEFKRTILPDGSSIIKARKI